MNPRFMPGIIYAPRSPAPSANALKWSARVPVCPRTYAAVLRSPRPRTSCHQLSDLLRNSRRLGDRTFTHCDVGRVTTTIIGQKDAPTLEISGPGNEGNM